MALHSHPLARQRIADVVRLDAATAQVFAELGIGPRYLFWTIEEAARAQGVEIESVIRAVVGKFGRRRVDDGDALAAMVSG